MSAMLYAALCLALGQAPDETAMRVDWSVAVGAHGAIADARRDYVRAVNAGQATAESLYTRDALGNDGGSGPMAARAAAFVARLHALAADRPAATITLVPHRFAHAENMGSETGTFVETRSRAGRSEIVEGLYVAVYSRGPDGRWRIAMEVRTTGSRAPLAVW
jgi:ketosteroid isomerase-like protein